MKTILTRTHMVTLLATSISAFAKSADVKTDQVATSSNATQQADCNRKTDAEAKQDNLKSDEEQTIKQQDKDWQHDLQGIYGG
jgi:hypothetical protein